MLATRRQLVWNKDLENSVLSGFSASSFISSFASCFLVFFWLKRESGAVIRHNSAPVEYQVLQNGEHVRDERHGNKPKPALLPTQRAQRRKLERDATVSRTRRSVRALFRSTSTISSVRHLSVSFNTVHYFAWLARSPQLQRKKTNALQFVSSREPRNPTKYTPLQCRGGGLKLPAEVAAVATTALTAK